jgi:uncharacterized damage-inducible protein DinB
VNDLTPLQYPIGPYQPPSEFTPELRQQLIERLHASAANLRAAITGLDEQQLNTPYRPGGWTVRQTVHHIADACVNGYIRTKLGLTEDAPPVKPFEEKLWAETADSREMHPEVSVRLVEALIERWVAMWRSLSADQFARTFGHPVNGPTTLDATLAFFVWHNEHHTAQITSLRKRMGW